MISLFIVFILVIVIFFLKKHENFNNVDQYINYNNPYEKYNITQKYNNNYNYDKRYIVNPVISFPITKCNYKSNVDECTDNGCFWFKNYCSSTYPSNL